MASPHASDWLIALPNLNLGLMGNKSLQIAAGLRLGAPIVHPFKCANCGTVVDSSDRHGLSCIKAKGTFPRHLNVNDILSRAMSSAHACDDLEPLGLPETNNKRPDGITLFPWKLGTYLNLFEGAT